MTNAVLISMPQQWGGNLTPGRETQQQGGGSLTVAEILGTKCERGAVTSETIFSLDHW